MSFMPELDGLSLQELSQRFDDPCPDPEESGLYYSEIAYRIAGLGQAGIAALQDALHRVAGERLAAVLFGLTLSRTADHISGERLRRFLHDPCNTVVMEAIDGLRWLGDKEAKNDVVALRSHPSGFVGGAVLRYLAGLFPDEAIPILLNALSDPDYIVRESAVDELDELRCFEAVPFIQPLIHDAHPHVRQAAQTAVENLSAERK